jgi:hypothetical protein
VLAGAAPEDSGTAQPVAMRLNQVPGDIGGTPVSPGLTGGQQKLVSTPAQKQAAANAIEQHIEPDTRKAGDYADAETNAAVKAFRDGWHTSGALKKAHGGWGDQVKNLMNRLASDKAALRNANATLQGTDYQVGANSQSVSVLNGY